MCDTNLSNTNNPGSSDDQKGDKQSSGSWETPIIRGNDEEPIGVTLCLTKEDLKRMNIDFSSNDIIFYQITEDGDISLSE